jgi:hypothetical protein
LLLPNNCTKFLHLPFQDDTLVFGQPSLPASCHDIITHRLVGYALSCYLLSV